MRISDWSSDVCSSDLEKDVLLLQAWEGEELIGLLPVTTAHRHGRLPLANITNWMHQHCFYGAPLIRRGYERAAWTSFLDVLDKSDWAPNFLHLSTLDGDGANANALKAVCAQQGRGLRCIHHYERALLQSDLTADAYWETDRKSTSELQSLMRISYAV